MPRFRKAYLFMKNPKRGLSFKQGAMIFPGKERYEI